MFSFHLGALPLLLAWTLCSASSPRREVSSGKHVKIPANEFTWPTQKEAYLDEETYTGESITLTGSLTIEGESRTGTTITVKKGVQYNTATYRLKFETLRITASEELDAPLINAQSGALKLEDVTVEGITLASTALLYVQTVESAQVGEYSYYNAIDFEDVVFKDITRKAASGKGGSVFEIDSIDECFLLSDCTFDNCQCTDGLGGAIFINHTSEDTPEIIIAATFQNVQTSAAKTGLCVYIDLPNLNKEDIEGAYTGLSGLLPQKDGYHMFKAKDMEKADNIYTLFDSDENLFIDHTSASAGTEDNTCGAYLKPCTTISAALKSKKFTADNSKVGTFTLAYGVHSAETAVSTVTRELTISGPSYDADDATLTVATIGSNGALITVDATNSDSFDFEVYSITFKATAACSTGLFKLAGSTEKIPRLILDGVKICASQQTITFSTPVIDATAGNLRLKECQFRDFTMTNCPALKINLGEDRFSCIYLSLETLTRTTGNGLLIEDTLTASTRLSISSLRIEKCVCTDGAGVIYLTVGKDVTAETSVDVSSLFLTQGHCVEGPNYCAIAFAANAITDIVGEKFNFNPSDITTSGRYYAILQSPKITTEIYHLTTTTSWPYIGTEAVSTSLKEYCGWKDIPCGPLKDYLATSGTLYLLEGAHKLKEAAITLDGDLTLSGESSECSSSYSYSTPFPERDIPSIIQVVKNDKFITGTYELTLKSLKICQASGAAALEDHLIDATSGTLTCNYVQFVDITLKGTCLLTATILEGSPTLFRSIKRADAGEASKPAASVLIYADVAESNYELKLQGFQFDSCVGATTGLGGAVYMKFTDVPANGYFGLGSYPFTGTVSASSSLVGQYMYLDLSALEDEAATQLMDKFRSVVVDTTENAFVVKKKDGKDYQLYKELGISQISVTVDTAGTTCTHTDETKKCPTLTEAIALIDEYGTLSGNTVTISASSLTQTTGTFQSSKGVSISGGGAKVTVTELPTDLFSFSNSKSASDISKLDVVISLTSDSGHNNLVYVNGYGGVTLSDMSFTSGLKDGTATKNCELQYYLIYASSGKVTLSGVSFSDITIDDYSLLSVSTQKDMFTITSTTTFTNIIRNEGSGTVFDISEYPLSDDDALVIQNAEFTKCKALNGNGGAICVEVGDTASFTLKNCKFTGCEAGTISSKQQSNARGCYGGAIYLELSDEPEVILADLTVKDCKASAANGGNALFAGYKLDDGQTVPDSYWKKMMGGLEGLSEDDWIAVTSREGETPSDPIKLSKFQKEDDDDDGFPTWAIIVIVVVGVVIIAAVVAVIIYLLKCRKKGVEPDGSSNKSSSASDKSSPSDAEEEGRSTEMAPQEEEKAAEDPAPTE